MVIVYDSFIDAIVRYILRKAIIIVAAKGLRRLSINKNRKYRTIIQIQPFKIYICEKISQTPSIISLRIVKKRRERRLADFHR